MSKFNFSILIIFCFISIFLIQIDIIYKNSLPLITLSENFQNTIGEIPLIKKIDESYMNISRGGQYLSISSGMVIYYSNY